MALPAYHPSPRLVAEAKAQVPSRRVWEYSSAIRCQFERAYTGTLSASVVWIQRNVRVLDSYPQAGLMSPHTKTERAPVRDDAQAATCSSERSYSSHSHLRRNAIR